jgi:ATP-dependent Clp protease ATP-binding subunit ClpC
MWSMPILFNSAARATLDRAQAASRRRGHEYVGQEHILLAILDADADAKCAGVVRALGLDAKTVTATVDSVIKRGREPGIGSDQLPYTSRAHKSLELAINAAGELGSAEAGPEHLLVGLCDEGMGIGAQVLADAGINGAKARYAAGRMAE